MFKQDIIGAIMGAIMRGADNDEHNLIVTLTNLSDIAQEAADDVLNLIEERTSRYYESSELEETA